ncbi:MAG: hypothetical protein AB1846_02925 [Chloroflexota bacterium]
MLTRLSETLQKYAKGWLVLILFLLDGLFIGLIMPGLQKRMQAVNPAAGPLDLMFFYSPDEAYSMIASYGDQGRAAYRTGELTLDIIHPILYTLFFSLLITWLFQRGLDSKSRLQRLNVVPFGALTFDLLENASIVAMLSLYPTTTAWLAWAATIFSMTKWLYAGAGMALVLVGIAAALRKR